LSIYAELVAERPRDAQVRVEAVDPVCGMTVAVSASTLSLEIDGRQVYFCGTGCRDAFVRSG
jgi:xanthine dehydrogenase accessory factor